MLRLKIFVLCFGLSVGLIVGEQVEKKEKNVYYPSVSKMQREAAWKEFNSAYQGKWKVKWNPVTGTPRRISGYHIKIPDTINKENVEQVTRSQLEKYKRLLQIDPGSLVLAKADRNIDKGKVKETWYIYYHQKYKNLPVLGGSVRLIIRNQKMTQMASNFYPGITVSTEIRVSKEDAIRRANLAMGEKTFLDPIGIEKVILPRPITNGVQYHLAWQVTMPVTYTPAHTIERNGSKGMVLKRNAKTGEKEPEKEILPVQWRYYVDAHTGVIIKRENLMRYENFNGRVTGMVHPFVPADTLEELPIANMTVILSQDEAEHTTVTDSDGNYSFTGLTSNPATITASLTGPHVIIHNNETMTVATHSSAITVPGTHDWNWSTDDTSPDQVETNVFYHVNKIHEWFNSEDPFNIIPEPYPMDVYVRDKNIFGEFYCNAMAGLGGLYFSGVLGTCEDFGLCVDIICHEYTHRIVQKVYDDAGVLLPYYGQTGAMNEGWADYFAATLTDNPEHGIGCHDGRNIDTPDKRFLDDWIGEVHYDGMIFSGSIWDVRTALGNIEVDSLALRAMKHAPETFSEYLESILEEDDNNSNLSDGTPNIDTICHHFYDIHGIYHSTCAGYTESPVAVITSPHPLEFNLLPTSSPVLDIVGSALGSSSITLDNFVLEYASESTPDTWETTGMTMTGGGTTPVSDDVLGQWDTEGIADGFYMIRLRVTDSNMNEATALTSIVIDNMLMNGWPQAVDTRFYGSPAVADIDPGYPGLEVVANGKDYNLYVWHADGTDVAGWPQFSGSSMSSPTVGDIDGDGDLEIVMCKNYICYVFHHDGSQVSGWPQAIDGVVGATPVLADLEGDGELEIILGADDNNVYAWHHDGIAVTGWPITVPDKVFSSASVGDLDNDGLPEIVVGCCDGNVYAWDGDGSTLPGWPQATSDAVRGSAALGDLDGDGDLEIVIPSMDMNVYAWHHDGTPVSGWPQAATQFIKEPSSTTLADLDSDGDLEVLVQSNDNRLHAWHGNGTPVSGWPPSEMGFNDDEYFISSPVIGDIDDDDHVEVVAEDRYVHFNLWYLHRIFSFNHDASLTDEWPKLLSSFNNSSPALADIDQDGDLEILIGTGGLFVWDLPASYNHSAMEWPFYRHDIRRTGAYGPREGVVLLFDTSGSMSWSHTGISGVPEDEQRLFFAKTAAFPFMELLNDHGGNRVNFGIAVFPHHPWDGCKGQVVTPMTLTTNSSKNTANYTTIPGLVAENSTPLLAGINTAKNMFGAETNRAIVLLSDGYHNCPSSVDIADTEVTNLVNQLKAQNIKVYTIGFGRPTDVDHPLLETLAGETSGQFYDVTTPGFVPTDWTFGTAATELQSTYKSILADALELETPVDPTGIIQGDGKITQQVTINKSDKIVSIYLSWVTPNSRRLVMGVTTSDGNPITPGRPGVRFHTGKTYQIITLLPAFLQQPGKVGSTPWKIEIVPGDMKQEETEHYQYSVIISSGLKMETALDETSYETGDRITITAKITEKGKPVASLDEVYVKVIRPGEGIGNWFAGNRVTEEELKQIPSKIGEENISPILQKSLFLTDIRKVPFPTRRETITLRLYDDGSHGDPTAHDGSYTNQYTDTLKEGTYRFYVTAKGTDQKNVFQREALLQEYVTVKPDAKSIFLDVLPISSEESKKRFFKLVITPKDALGNFLGPRYPGLIKVKTSWGSKLIDTLTDQLDGTYTQTLVLSDKISLNDVDIRVMVKGAACTYNLARQLQKPLGISFHPGSSIPLGNLNHLYNPGLSLGWNLDYHFTSQISLVGYLGYNRFNPGLPGIDDTFWWNISANLKYEFNTNPLRPYINGGSGIYIPKNGNVKPGVNFGLGWDYSINANWIIELGGDYHRIFTGGTGTSFFTAHTGLIFRL